MNVNDLEEIKRKQPTTRHTSQNYHDNHSHNQQQQQQQQHQQSQTQTQPSSTSDSLFDEYDLITADFRQEFNNNLKQLRHQLSVLLFNHNRTAEHEFYPSSACSSSSSNRNSSTSSSSTTHSHSLLGSNTSSRSSSRNNLSDTTVLLISSSSSSGDPSSSSSTSSSSSRSSQHIHNLNNLIFNLNDLFEFYKSHQQSSTIDAKFVEYLLIKKLNYVNGVYLNANKKLTIRLQEPDRIIAGPTLLELNDNYSAFEQIESRLGELCELKLNVSFTDLSKLSKLGELATLDAKYSFAVYQFDKSYRSLPAAVVSQTVVLPKRSTSADPRLIRLRQQQQLANQKKLKLEINLSDGSDYDEQHDDEMRQVVRLNEKCLQVTECALNADHSDNCLLRSVDLTAECCKLVLVVYKHVTVPSEGRTVMVKEAVSHNCYEVDHEKATVTLVKASHVNRNDKGVVASGTTSNMLRRMFKSKSKSRTNSTSRAGVGSSTTSVMSTAALAVLDSSQLIQLSLTSNQFNFYLNPSVLINIDAFEQWALDAKPAIVDGHICLRKFKNPSSSTSNRRVSEHREVFNLYLTRLSFQTKEVKRRSKLDQHRFETTSAKKSPHDQRTPNATSEPNLDATNVHYFIRLRVNDRSEYQTRVFKPSELINDLVRLEIPLSDDADFNLKCDLYKLNPATSLVKLIASNSNPYPISRTSKQQRFEVPLTSSGELLNVKLKMRLQFRQNFHPTNAAAVRLLDTSSSQNPDLLESTLDTLLAPAAAYSFDDLVLFKKYYELFLHANSRPAVNTHQLQAKLYVCFLKSILAGRKHHSDQFESFLLAYDFLSTSEQKTLIKCLVNLIKQAIEYDDMPQFRCTLQAFDTLVLLLVTLSQSSNSQLEFKYILNDLFLKLTRQLKTNPNKRTIIQSGLNLHFLNYLNLNDLFNGIELTQLIVKMFELDNNNAHVDYEYLTSIFQMDVFRLNFQFRDKLIEMLITNVDDTNPKLIYLIKYLLRLKSKLSKMNLDLLIKCSFGFLTRLQVNDDPLMENRFLCLIELLDLIMEQRRLQRTDLDKLLAFDQLQRLFSLVADYFKLKRRLFGARLKLTLSCDLILFKFGKFVQKFLFKYLINYDGSGDESSTEYGIIKAYFDMLFSYVERANDGFMSDFKMKISLLDTMWTFWKCLNVHLKRSDRLNEHLTRRLATTFVNNQYFRASAAGVTIGSELIGLFLKNLFLFVNDLYTASTVACFTLSALYALIVRTQTDEKSKSKSLAMSARLEPLDEAELPDPAQLYTSHRAEFLQGLERVFRLHKLQEKGPFHERLKLCMAYALVRDEPEMSIVEKYLLLIKIVRLVDQTTLDVNSWGANGSMLSDMRRKAKLFLLNDLYELNKSEKNYLHMCHVRKEQGDELAWSASSRTECELKEIFYLKALKKYAIHSLQEKFLNPGGVEQTPVQFDICKQLCGYYEKLDENYLKYTRILNAESKFAQLASANLLKVVSQTEAVTKTAPTQSLQHHHHGHMFFRVGFFGRAIRLDSIQNRYFLYRHKTYEMLSNVQSLILNKLSYAHTTSNTLGTNLAEDDDDGRRKLSRTVTLLHHNQEPEQRVRDSVSSCFVQICALNRIDKGKLIELVDEMNDDDDDNNGTYDEEQARVRTRLSKNEFTRIKTCLDTNSAGNFYYFDRPFYSSSSSSAADDELKEHESVENLWIERNVLVLDERYEMVSQFNEIVDTFRIMLNPIRNAISDINEKTKELKHFVVEFTANVNNTTTNNVNIHSLQPLTMRLLGCLDARVNGGLIKYVKELLNEQLKLTRKKKYLMYQLYVSIKEQLNVLESGLSIHDRILKELECRFGRDCTGSSNLSSTLNAATARLLENLTDLDSNPGASSFSSAATATTTASVTANSSNKKSNYSEHIKHMNELNKHLIDCLRLVTLELNERWSRLC